jgi:hypothetical protein
VVARDRAADLGTPDPVLSTFTESDLDELWLFALDGGDGLSGGDGSGITRFRERGGGILTTRDHQDMGSSLCTLGGVGAAHHFHTKNPEAEPTRSRGYPVLCSQPRALGRAPEVRDWPGLRRRPSEGGPHRKAHANREESLSHTNMDVERKSRLRPAGRRGVENGPRPTRMGAER